MEFWSLRMQNLYDKGKVKFVICEEEFHFLFLRCRKVKTVSAYIGILVIWGCQNRHGPIGPWHWGLCVWSMALCLNGPVA